MRMYVKHGEPASQLCSRKGGKREVQGSGLKDLKQAWEEGLKDLDCALMVMLRSSI